ncbi:MAG: putative drug exporter of the superfamily [Actinomycetota bacterium]|nr:putative drug exporter of the superfamily [Actinomycetota bacterium]
MLERIARWSYLHRWRMVVIWVAVLIGINVIGGIAGAPYSMNFSLPGTDSQRAYDLLRNRFPQASGDTADIAFKATPGVTDPAVKQKMDKFFADISKFNHVDGVSSPYAKGGERQISPDGHIGLARIQFDVTGDKVPIPEIKKMEALAAKTGGQGLTIDLGGSVVTFAEFQTPGGAEAVALVAAMFILLVTFGSVLAMGLPLMTALFGIGIGLAIVTLSAHFLTVPNFTPQLASMIGIGVGVDYALFIVTRYRQQLAEGMQPEQATIVAITTAGRAVLFAGTVVVISFLGILLMGFAFVQGIAVGGAAAVLVTMLASITLLPAVLGFVGSSIDRFHLPRLLHRDDTSPRQSIWFRWSRVIQRRPWPVAILALLVLIALTIPLFSLRLGSADAGTGDKTRSSRRAYDLLSEGFGPGFNGPLLLAAGLNSPKDLATLTALQKRLAQVPGVAGVTPPTVNPKHDAAIMQVFPTTSPQDAATTELVHTLRDRVIPAATAGTGTEVLIGGLTAGTIDFADQSGSRLPILIGVVLLLSFLLLVAVFRSVVVPAKAVVMNLLSIGASYGVVVAVFQWGWLKSAVGSTTTGPIEAWVPMLLFTILFGLSMDYEIFLLSRIREDYVKNHNNGLAVANGLASTARVITAAAAIMVTVFLSFVIGFDERAIKLFGFGLAVAIFVDATLIRMVLVPATMELLGDANWWFPKWLGRLVPKISIEPTTPDALETS